MRNDKIYVGIFLGQQLAHRDRAHDIVENRQRKRSRDLANLSIDGSVVAVQLDADKPEFLDCLPNQSLHPSSIIHTIDEGKPKEPIRMTVDDACNLTVRDRIIGMKCGKQDRVGYSGPGGADEIFVKRRGRVPWSGQPVTFAGVAVAVYDHQAGSIYIAIL